MKFGLTQKVAVKIRKQPDEESLNRIVEKIEDECAVHYTFSVNDKQFLLHPTRRVVRIDFNNRYYSSFWTDVKGEFSETNEQNNLQLTYHPTKGTRAFLIFYFCFVVFTELCLVLAFAFGGMEDFWPLLWPLLIGIAAYLISYFATAACAKKIIAVIEKYL